KKRRDTAYNQQLFQTLARRFPQLTQTERRVCQLLVMHLRTKEIAAQMGIGERTVETHRQNIRRKMGVPKGKELSAFLCAI
ncbi:MAG: helix-turn-helix transcriptional regulator, partial [Chloroherpetonaceae bacterium]